MKAIKAFLVGITVIRLLTDSTTATDLRAYGKVVDGLTVTGLVGVTVGFFFDPLASSSNDLPILVSTNTDANGEFVFPNLSGELSGHLQIVQLPAGYVVPMMEQIRLSSLTPTNQVIFRAGPPAAVTGTITITNGTTDLTKFRVEVNATEVDAATNGTFLIPELPACQQTMRLIYQDGFYFDERVVPLPALTAGVTNSVSISWHKPMNNLTVSGVLRDTGGNVLGDARIRFLGATTGVFVGMKTDTNGNYAIYDLPNDCYTVRAFVGRWGIEQRLLIAPEGILCLGGDSVGDGIPDAWRRQFFGGTGTTTNSLSCAACDPDGDGVSNLDEYRRGTSPTNAQSKNIALYANSVTGSNSYDGLAPTVAGGHGPKRDIQAAIAASITGDSVQIAGDQAAYPESVLSPRDKTLTLQPTGTVTIRP